MLVPLLHVIVAMLLISSKSHARQGDENKYVGQRQFGVIQVARHCVLFKGGNNGGNDSFLE